MRRVLILEPDEMIASRLRAALRHKKLDTVSRVPTMQEACQILTRQPQELAIIPLQQASRLVHSFRALQPDLPVVLTATETGSTIPDGYGGLFQGILNANTLESEIDDVLAKALGDSAEETAVETDGGDARRRTTPERSPVAAQEEDSVEGILLVMLSADDGIISQSGRLGEAQVLVIDDHVWENWDNNPRTALIQYYQLADYFDPLLLYTEEYAGKLVTVAALPATPLGTMRKQAEALIALQASEQPGEAETLQASPGPAVSEAPGETGPRGRTFAIAWRPVAKLPDSIRRIIRNSISGQARKNGCSLSFLAVEAELVHIVVSCPPGRGSAWVAHLFKDGSEKEIQAQFGVEASLWPRGYYATESSEPLEQAELGLFLHLD